MSDDLNVAIIIVTYKSALLTVDCLRSIQAERAGAGLAIRVIVIDNASGDFHNVAEAIRDNCWSAWATCLLAPRNGGFAYGNNLGMQIALSEGPVSYFYLLNPDTQLRPGSIHSLIRFMESNAAAGIAGGSFENHDGSEWPLAFRFPSLVGEFLAGMQIGMLSRLLASWVVPRNMSREVQPTDWICGAAMMIRATLAISLGGMDENYFLYFEETDFCRRALCAGFTTWYVPESRVMHISGQSTNVTGATERSRRLPSYWFESRRRYFAVTFGRRHAMLIDLVAIVSQSLGLLKQRALRRVVVPYFVRDLVRHTILRRHNRAISPLKSPLIRG